MTGSHDARRRLLDACADLLAEEGVAGATPAAVAGRAGAGKMSIYRHFAGKDDLMAAALADREPRHRGWLVGSEAGGAEAVLALFERVSLAADRAERFAGCPYVAVAIEVRDPTHPAVAVAREHKRLLTEELERTLAEGGVDAAGATAKALILLLDGAAAHAVIVGDGKPIREAGQSALRLLVDRATVVSAIEGKDSIAGSDARDG